MRTFEDLFMAEAALRSAAYGYALTEGNDQSRELRNQKRRALRAAAIAFGKVATSFEQGDS